MFPNSHRREFNTDLRPRRTRRSDNSELDDETRIFQELHDAANIGQSATSSDEKEGGDEEEEEDDDVDYHDDGVGPSFAPTQKQKNRVKIPHEDQTNTTPRFSRFQRSVEETRLVIGIDYGTTFTGIAYSTVRGTRAVLSDIKLVNDWGEVNEEKVPSVISYSSVNSNGEPQWGANIRGDAVTMMHTKLQLDVQPVPDELDLILGTLDGVHNFDFEYMKETEDNAKYSDKSPEQVVTDYLKLVFEYLLKTIPLLTDREMRKKYAVDIVITVPTGWSFKAKNSMYRAVRAAGFNETFFPGLKDITFVTEPEAAAIYTARNLKENPRHTGSLLYSRASVLRTGEYFILCDAGGGTVDVVSYEVKSLEPTLKLERFKEPTGDKCGSVQIDFKFKRWLRWLLGDERYHLLDLNDDLNNTGSHSVEGEAMRALMKDFILLKKRFTNNMERLLLDLPPPLDKLTIPGRVRQGEIEIPNSLMQHFFDSCLKKVIHLIKAHITRIEELGTTPKNLFLIGGFSESPYFAETLRLSLQRRDIVLHQPDTSWTAVARGAVICGIEKSATQEVTTTSTCKRSYGIVVKEKFSEAIHDHKDKIDDPFSKSKMANGQILWLLEEGQLVLSRSETAVRQPILISFKQKNRKGALDLYAHRLQFHGKRPTRFKNVSQDLELIATLEYNLSSHPIGKFEKKIGTGGSPYYCAKMMVVLTLKENVLEAAIEFGKETVSMVKNIPY